jgi:hypothetical protein
LQINTRLPSPHLRLKEERAKEGTGIERGGTLADYGEEEGSCDG